MLSSLRSAQFQSTASKQRFHRPAAGEALFTAEKDPKRLAPGRAPVRRHASPIPCASHRMRAGTNSHILVLKHRCLAPAFGCDAQRALRRVVALGPHIRQLLLRCSTSGIHAVALCYLPAFSFHPTAIIVSHRTLKPGLEASSAVTRGTAKRWNRHPTLDVFGAFLLRFLCPLRTKELYSKNCAPRALRFSRVPSPESRVPSPESRVPSPESRAMLCDECETR